MAPSDIPLSKGAKDSEQISLRAAAPLDIPLSKDIRAIEKARQNELEAKRVRQAQAELDAKIAADKQRKAARRGISPVIWKLLGAIKTAAQVRKNSGRER